MAQLVKYLLLKNEDLRSIPSIQVNKKKGHPWKCLLVIPAVGVGERRARLVPGSGAQWSVSLAEAVSSTPVRDPASELRQATSED